jgi:hypothetical protein
MRRVPETKRCNECVKGERSGRDEKLFLIDIVDARGRRRWQWLCNDHAYAGQMIEECRSSKFCLDRNGNPITS